MWPLDLLLHFGVRESGGEEAQTFGRGIEAKPCHGTCNLSANDALPQQLPLPGRPCRTTCALLVLLW
jgi:hypothetical protein